MCVVVTTKCGVRRFLISPCHVGLTGRDNFPWQRRAHEDGRGHLAGPAGVLRERVLRGQVQQEEGSHSVYHPTLCRPYKIRGPQDQLDAVYQYANFVS